MEEHWELPLALMGGTPKMRKLRDQYLPMHPKETVDAYENRLKQAVLFNYFKKTIQSLVGHSFLRSVVVSDVPEQLEYLESNIDGAHTTVTDFAASLLADTLIMGKSHDYTDFPTTTGSSLRDFRNFKAYATKIDPQNVIGWKIDSSKGYEDLIEVRVMEVEVSENEDWEEVVTNRVKVIRKDEIVIYEEEVVEVDGKTYSEYVPGTPIPNTLGYIPLNVTYGEKTGFFKARSPLEDMAWLNLLHYQSTSDQNHILHVARVPFIFAAGFAEGELDNVDVGPNRMIVASNPDATMGFVEHTGQAIGAGRANLQDLVQAIGMMGADVLLASGNRADRQTAVAANLDQAQSLSIIQIIIRGIEESIKNIYITAGKFMQVDGAEDVTVTINDAIGLPNDPNPVQSVISLLQALNLSEEEILRELKRRGIVSSTLQSLEVAPQPVNTPPEGEQSGEDDDSDENDSSTSD